MSPRLAAFAIPGDINTLTGGYIYERLLLENLRKLGHDVQHIRLAASFPYPTITEMDDAVDALTALPPDRALILDGLVYGSIDTDGLAKVRAPIVAMIHHPLARETGLDAATRDHLFRTERDNLALARHVLVPSPHTADILISEYAVPADRITIAQPGTDQPDGTRTPSRTSLILSVGIQHPRKGHDVLLRALALVTDLPWRAMIVGSAYEAAYAQSLSNLVTDLGLQDRVTLPGVLDRPELDDAYRQATLFALATRYEGYGMVFNEALTWGLPILSCATGAVPQTVPKDAGLLVPVDDHAALATALRTLLTDPDTCARMSAASLAAGRALPGWMDTARIASSVLNAL